MSHARRRRARRERAAPARPAGRRRGAAPQRRRSPSRRSPSSPREHEVVVTHGNGPQVGLLALQGEAYTAGRAVSARRARRRERGMIGYLLDQELVNALGGRAVATLLTQVIVDADDPAFSHPTKFIGPVYDRATAEPLAAERGWQVAHDGPHWRRVVPSPRAALDRRAADHQAAGRGRRARRLRRRRRDPGGRRPRRPPARRRGGDRQGPRRRAAGPGPRRGRAAAAHRRRRRRARLRDGRTPRRSREATADELLALGLPAGSMGPKVEAAAWFAQATGGRAAIGSLAEAAAVLAGRSGTTVDPGRDGSSALTSDREVGRLDQVA